MNGYENNGDLKMMMRMTYLYSFLNNEEVSDLKAGQAVLAIGKFRKRINRYAALAYSIIGFLAILSGWVFIQGSAGFNDYLRLPFIFFGTLLLVRERRKLIKLANETEELIKYDQGKE